VELSTGTSFMQPRMLREEDKGKEDGRCRREIRIGA
jgi:hypothetical protein